jgi:large subunit ribosomal protein LP0
MGGKKESKAAYFDKLEVLLKEYKSIFIVAVDNVSSQQMHEIRHSLRGEGVVLMGKNTMVRRALKGFIGDNPEYERLLPHVKGQLRAAIAHLHVLTAQATSASSSPTPTSRSAVTRFSPTVSPPPPVLVPSPRSMSTSPPETRKDTLSLKSNWEGWLLTVRSGMEPGKTSFFQALGVPTKIARGTIEITADLKLVEAGNKVGASEATLLNMLNISPFTYGMSISQIYDNGQTFASSVLDIEESQLLKAFSSAIATIASISLAVSYPTLPSVMHSVVNSYKKLLSVAIETDYEWEEIKELKDRIANPDAYASAAPTGSGGGGDAPAAAEETKAESEEEQSDEDMGFGLFD